MAETVVDFSPESQVFPVATPSPLTEPLPAPRGLRPLSERPLHVAPIAPSRAATVLLAIPTLLGSLVAAAMALLGRDVFFVGWIFLVAAGYLANAARRIWVRTAAIAEQR